MNEAVKQSSILGLVSIFIGVLWRLELEWHGWAGLDWLGYFHWAVPVGSIVFLGWFLYQSSGLKRRFSVLFVVTLLALFAYYFGGTTMCSAWSRMLGLCNPWIAYIMFYSPIFIYSLAGIAYYLALGNIGAMRFRYLFPGMLLYALAFPLTMLLLRISNHPGEADVIHAIKSGFVFVLISFAVGLPLVLSQKRKQEILPDGKQSGTFSWHKDRWRLFSLLTVLPITLLLLPFMLPFIPWSVGDGPFAALIWPGVVVYTGVIIAIVSQRVADWPSKAFSLWFNIMISILAALMTSIAIGFALDPT